MPNAYFTHSKEESQKHGAMGTAKVLSHLNRKKQLKVNILQL